MSVIDERPPVGIMPRWRWVELRRLEIIAAMRRYEQGDRPIPTAWLDELEWHAEVSPGPETERPTKAKFWEAVAAIKKLYPEPQYSAVCSTTALEIAKSLDLE